MYHVYPLSRFVVCLSFPTSFSCLLFYNLAGNSLFCIFTFSSPCSHLLYSLLFLLLLLLFLISLLPTFLLSFCHLFLLLLLLFSSPCSHLLTFTHSSFCCYFFISLLPPSYFHSFFLLLLLFHLLAPIFLLSLILPFAVTFSSPCSHLLAVSYSSLTTLSFILSLSILCLSLPHVHSTLISSFSSSSLLYLFYLWGYFLFRCSPAPQMYKEFTFQSRSNVLLGTYIPSTGTLSFVKSSSTEKIV